MRRHSKKPDLPTKRKDRTPSLLETIHNSTRFRPSPVRATIKALLFAGVLATIAFLSLPWILTRRRTPNRLLAAFHKSTARIFSITPRLQGHEIHKHRVLYVVNHVSYWDIVVLSACRPCRFIARADMRSWPLFGWLAFRQGSIFIDRVRHKAKHHILSVERALREDSSPLVLFAEGTTSNGRDILPVKSSLFALIETLPEPFVVQPITLKYSEIDGVPPGTMWEPFCAWYGKRGLVSHLYEFCSLGHVTVDLYFHAPFSPSRFEGGRKEMALACREKLREGLDLILHPDSERR